MWATHLGPTITSQKNTANFWVNCKLFHKIINLKSCYIMCTCSQGGRSVQIRQEVKTKTQHHPTDAWRWDKWINICALWQWRFPNVPHLCKWFLKDSCCKACVFLQDVFHSISGTRTDAKMQSCSIKANINQVSIIATNVEPFHCIMMRTSLFNVSPKSLFFPP